MLRIMFSKVVSTLFLLSSTAFAISSTDFPTETAQLTDAPLVPPAISRTSPAKVIINLEVIEVKKKLADGVDYVFWTYGGQVPGKFIRVREGDLVEFHLSNHPTSKVPHSIDLHAVTGQGGAAAASFTAPGHTSIFSFTATNPGLFMYHCATAPVPVHIGNGMYGLILVQPKEGLPPVDKEFYIMQGEFYTKGKFGEKGLQTFDLEKAVEEKPNYIVFNGAANSLTGDQSLNAKVGEKVRIYFGVGGLNKTSSFHVIGEIFDKVYPQGGSKIVNENVQTTMVPPGGSAIMEFKLEVPANYILVDHSIARAFHKGALGMLKVDGPENKEIYSGKQSDQIYQPLELKNLADTKSDLKNELKNNFDLKTLEERIRHGRSIYENNCVSCHQSSGLGIKGVYPPLAQSDFLKNNTEKVILTLLHGRRGKLKVNGSIYNGVMPAQSLNDEEIANVLTYIYADWGNNKKIISTEDVQK